MLKPTNSEGLKIATKGTLEGGQSYYPFASLFAYRTTLANIQEAQKEIGGFEGVTAPICVVTHSVFGISNPRMEDHIRIFLTLMLKAIEDSASSRNPFGVVKWLFG